MQWFEGYHHQVSNPALNDYRNMLYFKSMTGWANYIWQEWEVERSFMETQGNYNAYHHSHLRYMSAYDPMPID